MKKCKLIMQSRFLNLPKYLDLLVCTKLAEQFYLIVNIIDRKAIIQQENFAQQEKNRK